MNGELISVNDWKTVTELYLTEAWGGFLKFLPNLVIAIIVFIIGWFIAIAIGKLISVILARLKFNKLFEERGWREALEKVEMKVNPAEFIGSIFKWIVVIVSLSISVEILGLEGFGSLLRDLIAWLPNLIFAIAIFIIAVIVTDILDKIIRASAKKIGVKYVGIVGAIVRWAIYIFAVITVLKQFKIEMADWIANILTIAFAGIVIAGAIAFGLGGQHAAAKLIEDLREKISEE